VARDAAAVFAGGPQRSGLVLSNQDLRHWWPPSPARLYIAVSTPSQDAASAPRQGCR
jgi:hypothetical protein